MASSSSANAKEAPMSNMLDFVRNFAQLSSHPHPLRLSMPSWLACLFLVHTRITLQVKAFSPAFAFQLQGLGFEYLTLGMLIVVP